MRWVRTAIAIALSVSYIYIALNIFDFTLMYDRVAFTVLTALLTSITTVSALFD